MAGDKQRSDRAERLQLLLSDEEVAAIDDWRFSMRMPSRAAAIRDLIRRGLADANPKKATAGRASRDFGVVSRRG